MLPQLCWEPLFTILATVILASLTILAFQNMSPWVLRNLNQLRFNIRSRHLDPPIPQDIERWQCKTIDVEDPQVECLEIKYNNSWWEFLSTDFTNCGYALYVQRTERDPCTFVPAPVDGEPTTSQEHPYGRRLYKLNNTAAFYWVPCVRGARDRYGRDVVIRIVSHRSKPTTELKILRYLRSSSALQDPRNITIPIVDELEIGGLVFIVMPRWDAAWRHDFEKVDELMVIAETFLKYLEFLHEHRIAHMDLHSDNTAVNTIVSDVEFFSKGLRDPDVTKYAVFDFGASYMYPRDTPLNSAQETLDQVGWGTMGLIEVNVPFNPFHADVASMGAMLERRIRVLEDDIPEFVPLFRDMHHSDATKRPTAREALHRFQQLRANLTPEQLAVPVRGLLWHPVKGITLKPEYKPKKKK